ncbi:hypothetical protein BJX76DRAFT_328061 [Aspergillus varians]
MATYLITGASRGLGLELATQLTASPESEVGLVFATSRQTNPPKLTDLAAKTSGRLVAIQLDPNDPASLRAVVEEVERRLQGRGLDVLVNNVAVMPVTNGKIEKMEGEDLTDVFHTNVTLTHLVSRAFLPLLRKGNRKAIANISSTVGSIGEAASKRMMPTYAYKISKAGMNMLTVQYAQDYEEEGFSVYAISPGWLRTELGGDNADLPVETGAKEVIRYLRQEGQALNGRFLNIHVPGWENVPGPNHYDGKDPAW